MKLRNAQLWTGAFRRVSISIGLTLLFLLIPLSLSAQEKSESPKFTDQQLEYFENKVRPILVERCYDCHGPESDPIEGGLSVNSRNAIIAGGDTGPAITPGHADQSLLIDAINYGEVYEMPPDTKMPDEEIAVLTKWVNDGAPWPKESDTAAVAKEAFDINTRKANHWAWQPIKKQKPPTVTQSDWAKDPIDQFVLAKIESANLKPAEPAEKQTLIRRAYFDLIGMPPTREQVEAFLNDNSDDAFEKVIDELLDSPHYGERWARHWMDLSRFADTTGHEFDYPIHNAFRYRDYLIRAFNEDVPYKQFVHEHIAGDLIKNPRRHTSEDYNESILGTGFWFLGEAKHGAVDSKDEEARTIDNQIDVMSKSFLAMTVACARCHDHKFDAISTEDYYALSGFLQSSRRQSVMLDPGRTIEKSYGESTKLIRESDELANLIFERLGNADPKLLAKYVDAAVTVLKSDPTWKNPDGFIIEGETLKQKSVTGGETLVQEIKARGQFAWRGDKQYWWKHPKRGDKWTLEFEAPKDLASRKVSIRGVFTMANDYGIGKISINDSVALKRKDFYAPNLTTTGSISLGEHELKDGLNSITIVCLGKNKKATESRMFGIDYLQIVDAGATTEKQSKLLEEIAESKSVNPDLLKKVLEGIKTAGTKSKSHPLNLIRDVCLTQKPIDGSVAKLMTNEVKRAAERQEKWESESELFADFKDGLPDGWFRTGFAFGADAELDASKVSATNALFSSPQTVSSGRLGGKHFGVLRSPTFELKHEMIHYRYRGKGVTVRLIIDGFTMDEFNALLYSQCKIGIKESDKFAWQTQAGDLRNHLGSRAHLEIIDHGDGYIELDQIRMSHGPRPPEAPTFVEQALAKSAFDSQEGFSSAFAETIANLLKQPTEESAEFSSWIVEQDLAGILIKDADEELSSNSSKKSQEFVVAENSPPSFSNLVSRLKTARDKIVKLNQSVPHPILALGMTDGTGEEERIHIRGNSKTLGEPATRRFLSAISPRPLNPGDGSGRLLLAQKMTAPTNPLISRVAVNRLWHHLMGRGIVESVDNFGVLGKTPTHPELLDFLAKEFVRDSWSNKRMIKRIMLTSTYQMASTLNEDAKTIDPDNKLLHRANIRRLQGEAIRDSMLSISGRLDKKMYGPPVPIHLTKFMSGRGRPRSGPLDGEGRRSIYIAIRRNFLSPMMLAFDTPIPFNAIGKRNVSNVPAQALILMNDPFVIDQAKDWSERLIKTDQSTEDRIKSIYWSALGRGPTETELENATEFVSTQAKELKVAEADIKNNVQLWQDFCHVVFNMKEFIYVN